MDRRLPPTSRAANSGMECKSPGSDFFGVRMGSSLMSPPPSPRGGVFPGDASVAIEAAEENRVMSQIMSISSAIGQALGVVPDPASPPTKSGGKPKQAPAGGVFDHLLAPGACLQLLQQLPLIFRGDPPVDCGRTNGETAGLSCAYREAYGTQVFSPNAVVQHLRQSVRLWDPLPQANVVRLTVGPGSRLLIVGDTHGQLEDVLWMFFKYGTPTAKNQYLFNGDIVDRGGHALEIILLLLAFKRDSPQSVHIVRGNHEDPQCGIHFGFRAELCSKFPQHFGEIWEACYGRLFPALPLACVVEGVSQDRRFCVLHGGVPVDCPGQHGPMSLERDLQRIDRNRASVHGVQPDDRDGHLLWNLLWADPVETYEEKRGGVSRGNRFVGEECASFCQENGLSFVIRSHEVPRNLRGVIANFKRLCYTVFSASNYCGCVGNRGGVIICTPQPLSLQMCEHMAPPWMRLSEILQSHGGDSDEQRMDVCMRWESTFGIGEAPDAVPVRNTGECHMPIGQAAPAPADAGSVFMQFVMERIVEHKSELFDMFSRADAGKSGCLPKQKWAEVMLDHFGPLYPAVMTPECVQQFAEMWRLSKTGGVQYVRFLHRFQIRGAEDAQEGQPDALRAVSMVRRKLADLSAIDLERLLDPNGDCTVTHDEFLSFLAPFGVHVPPWQGAGIYETFTQLVRQHPLTLDGMITCLALVSRDAPPSNEASRVAERIGEEIAAVSRSYPSMFRQWDTTRTGFLTLGELERGLQTFLSGKPIGQHLHVFMDYLDSMGGAVDDRGVSMLEFVRSVASRDMTVSLQGSMVREDLIRVWLFRPRLLALLVQRDPEATNSVKLATFAGCLKVVNESLQPPLTEIQVEAICEAAAAGKRQVRYDRFINGLHVIDTGNLVRSTTVHL